MRKYWQLILLSVILCGCHPLEKGVAIESYANISTDTARQIFEADDRLDRSAIVFNNQQMVAAITVHSFSRFHKGKIEKELKEKLESAYPDLDITVSADYKAMHMLAKIVEKQGDDQVEDKMKEIVQLLEEET